MLVLVCLLSIRIRLGPSGNISTVAVQLIWSSSSKFLNFCVCCKELAPLDLGILEVTHSPQSHWSELVKSGATNSWSTFHQTKNILYTSIYQMFPFSPRPVFCFFLFLSPYLFQSSETLFNNIMKRFWPWLETPRSAVQYAVRSISAVSWRKHNLQSARDSSTFPNCGCFQIGKSISTKKTVSAFESN